MIARRLLILMLVMLAIASLSSVFLAEPGRQGAPPTTTTAEAPERPSAASLRGEGRLLKATLDASAAKPRAIRMQVGDQLALRVEARRVVQVELAGLGQLEDVLPPAPARFDLYADRPGRFAVRLLPSRRTIGVIAVTNRQ